MPAPVFLKGTEVPEHIVFSALTSAYKKALVESNALDDRHQPVPPISSTQDIIKFTIYDSFSAAVVGKILDRVDKENIDISHLFRDAKYYTLIGEIINKAEDEDNIEDWEEEGRLDEILAKKGVEDLIVNLIHEGHSENIQDIITFDEFVEDITKKLELESEVYFPVEGTDFQKKILKNLAVIYAGYNQSKENLIDIIDIAVKLLLGSEQYNKSLLNASKQWLESATDILKKDINAEIPWSTLTSAREEVAQDTVSQRLVNAIGDIQPTIDFSSNEMLDAQDIRNILSAGERYTPLYNTKKLPDFNDTAIFKTWIIVEPMMEAVAEKELPLLINRIQEYINEKNYNELLRVGIIVTRGEGESQPHHVNVTLTYNDGKFTNARIGDSIATKTTSSEVGKEVASFIGKATTQLSEDVKPVATDPLVGHHGVLCGDLALMDLEEQLEVDLFDNRMQMIKQELQEGKLEKGKLGRRIREATYFAVAEGKAKSIAAGDKAKEEALREEFFNKVKETADRERSLQSPSTAAKQDKTPSVAARQDKTPSDKINAVKNKDGSITLTGEILTAKITEDENNTPILELSFSKADSKNEETKDMGEAAREQKYKSEFGKILQELYRTLLSSARKNNWGTNDEGKIIVDIVISGGMKPQEQKRLKGIVGQSTHFALGNVTHAKDETEKRTKTSPGKPGLSNQSMMNMRRVIGDEKRPSPDSNVPTAYNPRR